MTYKKYKIIKIYFINITIPLNQFLLLTALPPSGTSSHFNIITLNSMFYLKY